MKFRAWTDNIDPRTIPHQVLLSELGRRNSAKRKTFASGPGRPSKGGPRCACGKYALATAQKYHHHCPHVVEVRVEGDKVLSFLRTKPKRLLSRHHLPGQWRPLNLQSGNHRIFCGRRSPSLCVPENLDRACSVRYAAGHADPTRSAASNVYLPVVAPAAASR